MEQDQVVREPNYSCAGADFYASMPVRNPVEIQPNTMRHLTIQEVHRGYIVQVGCHTFVFETAENLIKNINTYILNPQETEQKWWSKELFK